MIYRCKAPLRLGLAGGGTDIAAYADKFGGVVLNVTINLYATCSIETTNDGNNIFESADLHERQELPSLPFYPIENDDKLKLVKGVYNRLVRDYCGGKPLNVKVMTFVDAPSGSGLGTSSTVVVCILKCFSEMLGLPFSEYDLAQLAYSIERLDLNLHGGKQDQYAAVFGGFNFMEFFDNNKVIVNPLRIHSWIKNEIQSSLVVYYMGTSHDSSKVIDDQIVSVQRNQNLNLQAMHEVKAISYRMKEFLLKGEILNFEKLFNDEWFQKKKTSTSISNERVDKIYNFALDNGAISGKISGAGGGGCMFFFADPFKKYALSQKLLSAFGGQIYKTEFTEKGAESWKIYNEK